jgi:hypothetical protein
VPRRERAGHRRPGRTMIWASPALPGARHDMGAARDHGIIDALRAAGVRVIADNGYRRGERFEVPQRRRPADPGTGEGAGSHATSAMRTPHTLASEDPASMRTPSSTPGASSTRSAAGPVAPPTSSTPSSSSSTPADARWKGLSVGSLDPGLGCRTLKLVRSFDQALTGGRTPARDTSDAHIW